MLPDNNYIYEKKVLSIRDADSHDAPIALLPNETSLTPVPDTPFLEVMGIHL
jgi:hypothetical protein